MQELMRIPGTLLIRNLSRVVGLIRSPRVSPAFYKPANTPPSSNLLQSNKLPIMERSGNKSLPEAHPVMVRRKLCRERPDTWLTEVANSLRADRPATGLCGNSLSPKSTSFFSCHVATGTSADIDAMEGTWRAEACIDGAYMKRTDSRLIDNLNVRPGCGKRPVQSSTITHRDSDEFAYRCAGKSTDSLAAPEDGQNQPHLCGSRNADGSYGNYAHGLSINTQTGFRSDGAAKSQNFGSKNRSAAQSRRSWDYF